ncbi:acyl-CoA dehydrogenase family protein [Aldersonia kunmingensis]|uniref:acyl-CoA dehydrogenase family protein n=1 Tax=Aldersonia kunmingensis TaxID=408066 RepID=UPI00082B142D|nr:acyl-CoA dehydrogenase family protein [Aldersonia kunmingensis]
MTVITSTELDLLRAATRELLAERFAGDTEPTPDEWSASWAALAELGAWSTLEPPDGSLAAACVVAEELGRALYAGPAAETLAATVLATQLERVAQSAASAVFIGGIEGEQIVAPAPNTSVIAATEGGNLVAVHFDAVESKPVTTLDVTRTFSAIRIDPTAPRVVTNVAETARDAAAVRRLLYCADTAGAITRVLDRTVEYAGQRTTFGVPIGKYQAVAHRLVDHTITLRQLGLLIADAGAAYDNPAGSDGDFADRVAMAETFCCDRSADLLSDCIQLSGAIGFTWEYGHHFALRRAVQNTVVLGGSRSARTRLAEAESWGKATR